MNRQAKGATTNRHDWSNFMVHLTRDDSNSSWTPTGTARENFEGIFDGKSIVAMSPHCLHGKAVCKLPDELKKKFHVVCFTETPLSQLRHMIDLPGRQVNLEPYGFVFEREFIYSKEGHQAICFTEYASKSMRQAYDRLFEIGLKTKFNKPGWRMLPFVNVMHDGNDFAWEREWRVVGDADFDLADLVCVILPEHEDELRDRMAQRGIAALDPKWSPDQIIASLARQQRETRRIWKAKVPLKKTKHAR